MNRSSPLLDDPLLEPLRTVRGHKVIGGCVLYAAVAEGGMGAVYRATHLRLRRDVAVKLLLGRVPRGPERLLREARLGAALSHPNLVSVFDCGEERKVPFLEMEWVDGENLQTRMERLSDGPDLEPRPADEIRALARELSEALAVVHERGLVHRDIKPRNVMLTHDGVFKLADLGLARPVEGSDATVPGMVLGTPGFMAPEQARSGGKVTEAIDVFAFGATLLYLLTGRRAGASGSEWDSVIVEAREADNLPTDLEKIISICMQREPADRYANGVALRDGCRNLLHGTTWTPTHLSRSPVGSEPRPDDELLDEIAELIEMPDFDDSVVRLAVELAADEPEAVGRVVDDSPIIHSAPGERSRRRSLPIVISLVGFIVAGVALTWDFGGEPMDPEGGAGVEVSEASGDGDPVGRGQARGPGGEGTAPAKPDGDGTANDRETEEPQQPSPETAEKTGPGPAPTEIDEASEKRDPDPVPPPPVDRTPPVLEQLLCAEPGVLRELGENRYRLAFDGPLREVELRALTDDAVACSFALGERALEPRVAGASFAVDLPLPQDPQKMTQVLRLQWRDELGNEDGRQISIEFEDRMALPGFQYALQRDGSGSVARRYRPSDLVLPIELPNGVQRQLVFVRVPGAPGEPPLFVMETEVPARLLQAALRDQEAFLKHARRFIPTARLDTIDRWYEFRIANLPGLEGLEVSESAADLPADYWLDWDALALAAWLTERLDPDRAFGWSVRVPTTSEWERIACASFAESVDLVARQRNLSLGDFVTDPWLDHSDGGVARSVRSGSLQGRLRLFDLVGNLAEMTIDDQRVTEELGGVLRRGKRLGGAWNDELGSGRLYLKQPLLSYGGRQRPIFESGADVGLRLVLGVD